MSFLTLFLVSSMLYIVEANPAKSSVKTQGCGCEDKLDSFNKEAIVRLYSNGLNPLEYKEVLESFKSEMIEILKPAGMDPDILDQKFTLFLNEMEAQCTSETGMSVPQFKKMINVFVVKMIQYIDSPDYKLLGSKAKLAAFIKSLKGVLLGAGLNPLDFIGEMEKFVEKALELVGTAAFEPSLLKQKLDELLKQLTKTIGSVAITPILLKGKLVEFLKDLGETIADPTYSRLNDQKHLDNLFNDLFISLEGNLTPLMNEYKLTPEDQTKFKGSGLEAFKRYINYLLYLIQQKGYKGKKPIIPEQEDQDILVSFPTTDDDDDDDDSK